MQQNLETLNHDLSVESWDLTTPWRGACEGFSNATILTTIGAFGVGLAIQQPP